MEEGKENYQINKVKRNIPKWFSERKKNQINSQILLTYLEMYSNNEIVLLKNLQQRCSHLSTFSSNFQKMIDFTEKNSGKVFDVVEDKIYLWSPVKSFIVEEYSKYKQNFFDINYPDDIISDTPIIEGIKKQIIVNFYERNPVARTECIKHYGYNCSICGLNFEKVYGEYGKNFIHVHHIVPVSTIKKEYLIDPIKDLRPVCPNCHAMLHRERKVKSIDELKEMLRK